MGHAGSIAEGGVDVVAMKNWWRWQVPARHEKSRPGIKLLELEDIVQVIDEWEIERKAG